MVERVGAGLFLLALSYLALSWGESEGGKGVWATELSAAPESLASWLPELIANC